MFILCLLLFILILTSNCADIPVSSPKFFSFDCTAGTFSVKCETTSALELYHIDFARLTKVCSVVRVQNCSTHILPDLASQLSEWNKISIEISNLDWNTLDDDSFLKFVGLKRLIANHNKISTLAEGIFKQNHLIYLDLSYNQFENIEYIAEAGVSKLEVLLISYNNIMTINGTTFKNLNHLKILDMSFNNLTNIENGTFDLVPNLKNLSMAHNYLTFVLNFGIFTHLTFLELLDISNNRLYSIDIGLHSPVFQHFHRFKMESNGMKSAWGLNAQTFPQLNYLNLRNNNFECYILEEIVNSFDLKKLKLEMDPSTLVRRGVAIRGVSCRP